MRDIETIDSDLRLIAAVHRSIREHGGKPSSRQFDELLDERLAHRGGEERQPAALAAARRPGSISTYAVKEGGASSPFTGLGLPGYPAIRRDVGVRGS